MSRTMPTIPSATEVKNTICAVCEQTNTCNKIVDTASVPSNVRDFKTEAFRVWRCPDCLSLHSEALVDLAKYYVNYPVHKVRLDPPAVVFYLNRLRLLWQRGVSFKSRILDFGCGSGAFVSFLRTVGFSDVTGYDPYVRRFSDPATLNRKYDAVVSYDVIEHFDAPRDCLAVISGLVEAGGLIAIGTPNAEGIDLKGPPFSAELHQPYHRHVLSERGLIRMASRLGLELEHTYHRWYVDTLLPGLNSRFFWEYAAACDGTVDALVEPVRAAILLGSPRLWFYLYFGYFANTNANMLISFRKSRDSASTGA